MIKIIKYLPLFLRIKFYKDSGLIDINGKPILEGSIIRAKWMDYHWGSLPFSDDCVHCVELYEGKFGSDVHSDFEPLSMYDEVEVLGHVEEYRKFYNPHTGDGICGNFGSCIK